MKTHERLNMQNPSILIYDIEILKAVPPKDAREIISGVEYCGGWDDKENMGISCIGAYDYLEDRYRVFTKGNFQEFMELVSMRSLIVGFNSIPFDNAVVKAAIDFVIPESKSYDLLREIWIASGLHPEFQYPSHVGYGLEACCSANWGTKKTGNGAFAPVYWQSGHYGKVIDYCLNDVRLTKQLFDAAMYGAPITSPVDKKPLTLAIPKVG